MGHKILFFTPIFPPQYSGATFQAITLARELIKQGDSTCFLTLRAIPGRFPVSHFFREQYEDLEVVVVPVRKLREIIEGKCSNKDYLTVLLRLFFVLFLLRGKYSIIHCHILGFPFTALGLFGRLLNKKTIAKATMFDDLEFEKIGRLAGKLNRFFVFSFDRIISISGDIYESLIRISMPPKRIISIPNGVNTHRFHPVSKNDKANIRHKKGIIGNFVAIFVGGITYRKGVDTLIVIWSEFVKNYKDATLVLVGPCSEDEGAIGDEYCYDFVMKYLLENDLSNRVFFTGRVENVHEYLQMADLFVFPSTMEGMPNVVLEAMACALPVVSFNVSGIADIISHKKNGEVIKEGDHASFRNAIEKIYADEAVRARYSENATLSIHNRFSARKIAERYHDLYTIM